MGSTTLRVLASSRKPLVPGDVFVLGLAEGDYLFGRVISTTARWTAANDAGTANLIYVFVGRSQRKCMPGRDHLQTNNLLTPPMLINRLGWSRGYFETLDNVSFEPGELLSRHCFEQSSRRSPRWFNEFAESLPGPVAPVGQWGIGNHLTTENAVLEALKARS